MVTDGLQQTRPLCNGMTRHCLATHVFRGSKFLRLSPFMRSVFPHENLECIFASAVRWVSSPPSMRSSTFRSTIPRLRDGQTTKTHNDRSGSPIIPILSISESSWCGANSDQTPKLKLLFLKSTVARCQNPAFRILASMLPRVLVERMAMIDQKFFEFNDVPIQVLTCYDLNHTVYCVCRWSWKMSRPLHPVNTIRCFGLALPSSVGFHRSTN